jgi:hypothetical protein
MATLYVARSVKLGKWASDVGLSKHVYKLGVTEEPAEPLIAAGWAGETDWSLVKQVPVEDLDEGEAIERLARKAKMIDPNYYPRLKGTLGVFKVDPVHVENHILMTKALAEGAGGEMQQVKLKPADFAQYLIVNAQRSVSA